MVDESLITGEARPVAKGTGDALIGGARNLDGPLVMRVERVGQDTLLSETLRLTDRAQTEKPPVAQLA